MRPNGSEKTLYEIEKGSELIVMDPVTSVVERHHACIMEVA